MRVAGAGVFRSQSRGSRTLARQGGLAQQPAKIGRGRAHGERSVALNQMYEEWTSQWSRSPIVRIDSGVLDAHEVLAEAISIVTPVMRPKPG